MGTSRACLRDCADCDLDGNTVDRLAAWLSAWSWQALVPTHPGVARLFSIYFFLVVVRL